MSVVSKDCRQSSALRKDSVAERKNTLPVRKDTPAFTDRFREPDIIISEEEKSIIRRQWKVLSLDMKGTGSTIFLRIFEEHPEIKQLFSYTNVGDELLPKSSRLSTHAYRFMQVIGTVVDNIDEIEVKVAGALLALGKQHIHFTGFKPLYIQAFYDAILHVWKEVLGVEFTLECAIAWGHVLILIMEKLKKGYHLASLEMVTKG